MARVIGVRGIRRITDKMVDAGTEALKKFTKAAREDRVESELDFEAKQVIKGQFGIGDDDEVGLVLKAAALSVVGLDLDAGADVSFESSQTGNADVTLEVRLKISARDRAAETE